MPVRLLRRLTGTALRAALWVAARGKKGVSSPSHSPIFPKTRYLGKSNWKQKTSDYKNKYLFYNKL